jgi:acetylornithine deacetylase/succinyl-diaminopimelate desuccinylase-like protein
MLDYVALTNFIDNKWEQSIIPQLMEYIKIPNKSPMFDSNWQQHGYMEQAVQHISHWCQEQQLRGFKLDIIRLTGKTPLIFIEITGQVAQTILLYGHLDKQPEMVGWQDGLAPWQAVIRDNKLYGRGGADDGYAAFASLTAIAALQQQNIPHARCVIIIEASEESGSCDLPAYIEHLVNRIGQPHLVICLDSGCGNYEQLWNTTSLRGLAGGILTVTVLNEGVHSGNASGIVASSFRLLRQLLNRIEDENSGQILLKELRTEIPAQRIQEAQLAAEVLQDSVYTEFPLAKNTQPIQQDLAQLILNRTWRPALAITGAAGLPLLETAGNVLLPSIAIKLSMRLAPNCDAQQAQQAIAKCLTHNPPYQADICYQAQDSATG